MILYFSATGNSQWIAETIAKELDDRAVDLMKADPAAYHFTSKDTVGIVFPVYYCISPDPVTEFVKKLHINGAYTYAVCNYSNYAGHALQYLSREGMHLNSGYGLFMPDNTSVFGLQLDDEESTQRKLKEAVPRLREIIRHLMTKEDGVFDAYEGEKDPENETRILGTLYHSGEVTKTDSFSVTDKCIGCGLCARNCPAKAIELKEKTPVWEKSSCYMCAACINQCPVEAIEFEDKSQGIYRYTFRKYAKELESGTI